MKRIPKADPESLQGLFQSANERAAQWAEPEPWRASSPWPRRWPLTVSLIAGLLAPGVLASYFFAADASSGHVTAEPEALATDRSAALPIASGPAPFQQSESALSLTTDEHADPAPQHKGIRWVGADLLIDLERVPAQQAVQMLAAETRASIRGSEHVGARLVTLKWQGRDPRAAWHQLLGPLTGFSLACAPGSCQILIDASAFAATLAGTAKAPAVAPYGAAAGMDRPPAEADEPMATDE